MQAEPCPPAAEIRYLKEPLQVQSLEGEAPGYAKRLATTAFGLPSLRRWCLWIEPVPYPAERWSVRWRRAVDSALSRWREQVPVVLVDQPERAQIRVLRKRPPRRRTDTGWRASNGRSVLRLAELNRAGQLRREPLVELLISPDSGPRRLRQWLCMSLAMPSGSGDTAMIPVMPWLCIREPFRC